MRCTGLLVAVLSALMTFVTCQSSDDDASATWLLNMMTESTKKTDDDDNLNLDPVLDETDISGRTETTERTVEPPEDTLVKCTTEKGQDGVCVTYYLCDQDSKTVIEDGYTIIDIREGNACPNFLHVCCLRKKMASQPSKEFTTIDKNIVVTADAKPENQKPQPAQCGWSNPGANVLQVREGTIGVTDGNKLYADFGDFPWMVAVLKRVQPEDEWNKKNYIGGGSLIHPSVVMTVAHKITGIKPDQLKIRAGEWETTSTDELYDHQERDVSKIVIHPHYFRPSLYNDVGLLFLKEAVKLEGAPHIGVGCLGRVLPPANTNCFSMGWGANDFNNKSVFAPILKKVKLPLVESSDCQQMLRKTRLGQLFQLHSSLTCAGGKDGVDTCRGDGGSPLVCPINGSTRFEIIGMVAYGIQCGLAAVPGVYVNIPNLHHWVREQLIAEGYDYNSYVY